MATIAGLTQVPISQKNLDNVATVSLGETLRDALGKGCTSIIIALGGSATNDGGLSMLVALGMKAWDGEGNRLRGSITTPLLIMTFVLAFGIPIIGWICSLLAMGFYDLDAAKMEKIQKRISEIKYKEEMDQAQVF